MYKNNNNNHNQKQQQQQQSGLEPKATASEVPREVLGSCIFNKHTKFQVMLIIKALGEKAALYHFNYTTFFLMCYLYTINLTAD